MKNFTKIYDENFEIIIRIAYRFSGDLETAEDLCQETFIKYFEKFGNKYPKDEPKYYLIKIVKNLSINYEKRRKIEHRIFNRYKTDELIYEKDTGLSSLVK